MFLSFKGFAYSRSANFKSVFLQQSYKMHWRLGDVGWRQMFYKTAAWNLVKNDEGLVQLPGPEQHYLI